jgi:uncharacterized protein YciI
MKKISLIILVITLIASSCNQPKLNSSDKDDIQEVVFDSVMAAQLGADTYGMKKYVMAFLKKGPNRTEDSVKAAELQKAHLANINRLAEEGKLVVAGPFLDDGDIRGIYIFDVKTVEEAESLTKTDPAIKVGSLVMELHPWYGSAALLKINDIHNKIAKVNI